MSSYDERINRVWNCLTDGAMTAEDVARAFTNYHGMHLLDEGFEKFLEDEGYLEPTDDDDDDDDDDEQEDEQ